jgi:hypothetical protein
MPELPSPRPKPATPTYPLLEQSLHLLERSHTLREESRQLRAHFRKVCEQAGLSVGRPAPGG